MKRFVLAALVFAVAMSIGSAFASTPGNDKVACSVCGYLVDRSEAIATQFEGKTYYFCEAGCKAYFDRDPKSFAAGMDYDAVCGMTVDRSKAVKAVHNNREIYFCSEACKAKYFANPGEYEVNYDLVANVVKPVKEMKYTSNYNGMPVYFISEANKASFDRNPDAYLYAMCPVTGKTFLRQDAGAKMEYQGATYYFCCADCQKKFAAKPNKYIGKGHATAFEKCTNHEDAKAGCDEAKQTAEGCQKMMESGQCPHMKQKADVKKETKSRAKHGTKKTVEKAQEDATKK